MSAPESQKHPVSQHEGEQNSPPQVTPEIERRKQWPWRALVLGLTMLLAVSICIFLALIWVQDSIQSEAVAESENVAAPQVVVQNKPVINDANTPQLASKTQPAAAKSDDQHPIDPALAIAREGLNHMRENIRDYTATIIKRERAKNGKLGEEQFMFCKIRNRKVDQEGKVVVPLSVYLKFLKPKSVAGREVLWVEDQNDGKLVGHEAGLKNLLRYKLDPEGFVAMVGQRYPIYNIGMENLIVKLIERGERERPRTAAQVEISPGATIDDRDCKLIEVKHPEKSPDVDFYLAQIFIDIQRNIPLRYAAYLWPEEPNGEPLVDEEYTYKDVKLNVGLTDTDFDPDNLEYNFP